jgi:quercetin dioxygenase-like cupin family protein
LAEGHHLGMAEELSGRLAANIRHLAGVPRATWGHLESGSANPTLAVLHRAAMALQVPLEELTATPRASCRYYPRTALPNRRQGDAVIRELLPDAVPGMVIDRMEIAPHGRMTGVPHMPGTREYLTCESGQIRLAVAGEQWTLEPGDVVVFRGDQRHSYSNPGARHAVGYSVVLLAPVS